MTKLATIEGIGDVYDGKLAAIGIDSVEALLQAGASPKGRADLAEKSGISGKLILEWVNRATSTASGHQRGILGPVGIRGVDTVPELAQRNAANLHAALVQGNGEKKLVRHLPGESQVAAWIEQARALPRVVTYELGPAAEDRTCPSGGAPLSPGRWFLSVSSGPPDVAPRTVRSACCPQEPSTRHR